MLNAGVAIEIGTAAAVLVVLTVTVVLMAVPRSRVPMLLSRSLLGRFVPRWNFFAPVPGTKDFHVVWREWHEDRRGPWRDIPGLIPLRHPVDLVWNPDKFARKATIDLALELIQLVSPVADGQRDPLAAMLTLPYILLSLRASKEASRFPTVQNFQFAIVADSLASPKAEPVFVSRVHAV